MKRVRISITILETTDFDDNMTETAIDNYIDYTVNDLQKVLNECDFGSVNDIEYSIEQIDDEDEDN